MTSCTLSNLQVSKQQLIDKRARDKVDQHGPMCGLAVAPQIVKREQSQGDSARTSWSLTADCATEGATAAQVGAAAYTHLHVGVGLPRVVCVDVRDLRRVHCCVRLFASPSLHRFAQSVHTSTHRKQRSKHDFVFYSIRYGMQTSAQILVQQCARRRRYS